MFAFFFFVIGMASAPLPQDPTNAATILGLWLNEDGRAAIHIKLCEDQLCGEIAWLKQPLDDNGRERLDVENPDPTLKEEPILGLEILTGFPATPDKSGKWSGGRIYDPENGKRYKCKMEIEESGALKIRGFIGIPLFGRTTRWRKAQP